MDRWIDASTGREQIEECRKSEGWKEERCHQLINVVFLFPSSSCFKVIFLLPYYSRSTSLINQYLLLATSLSLRLFLLVLLSLLLFFTSIVSPLSKKENQKERGHTHTHTHTHTMKSFICPIKEAEAQRKVNIHLSLSLSLSLYLSVSHSLWVCERPWLWCPGVCVCVCVCVDRHISHFSGVSLKRIDCSATNKEYRVRKRESERGCTPDTIYDGREMWGDRKQTERGRVWNERQERGEEMEVRRKTERDTESKTYSVS